MESLIKAAGAIGVQVDDATTERFRRYRELLIEWGSRTNLTAIKDPEAIVEQLFIRSFRVAVQAGGSVTTAGWFDGRRIIDIGSGAGIPGLPLKLILPEADVTLLEANRKKCDFMEHVVADLGLDGIEIINERAEIAAHFDNLRESYDLATARVVAKLPVLAEYTLPFLKQGGVAVLPKGPDPETVRSESDEAAYAADEMGAAPAIIQAVAHPGTSPTDHKVYRLKNRPTSARYPRPAGIPAK
ncbi:MAG: 16S rRNA (guanine(527)-N(7))-methyltransferase RsmG, partial [Chloroflexi bacterium]|nr:16S rRNA (guanine(527)-N(7))-methyltransferase RsmG [Chloroflexota bacterium]